MIAAELADCFVDLTEPGSTDGVPFGQEAAGWIDRDLTINASSALVCPVGTSTSRANTYVLAIKNFRYRETVVQFNEIKILGADTSHFINLPGGVNRCLETTQA